MTKDKIKEIRELCEGATAGPWEYYNFSQARSINQLCSPVKQFRIGDARVEAWGERSHLDAKFIAASRALVPLLLDVIEMQRDTLVGLGKYYPATTANSTVVTADKMLEGLVL